MQKKGFAYFFRHLWLYTVKKIHVKFGRIDPTLKTAQDIISDLVGPENYYHTYKTHEFFYWGPAIPWLKELRGIKSVLDIGAAYGTLSIIAAHLYPGTELYVIDPVDYLNPAVKEKFRIKNFKGDIERNDFSEIPKCDLVIFTEVLEHLNFHPVPTLRKIYSMIAPGGWLLLSTPAAESGWGRVEDSYASVDEIPEYKGQDAIWVDKHIYQYTLEELNAVFAQTGFETVRHVKTIGSNYNHVFLLKKSDF